MRISQERGNPAGDHRAGRAGAQRLLLLWLSLALLVPRVLAIVLVTKVGSRTAAIDYEAVR
jgi:hypothetical protein